MKLLNPMAAHIIARNLEKQFIAEQVFGRYGITTDFIATDYPEIQADTSSEIARHTAELEMAVIREDCNFFIGALGFSGLLT